MIDKLIFEFHEVYATFFWLIALLACAAAYLTKEMTGRPAYAMASLPVFLAAAILGACVMRVADLQLGVDRLTDTIVGAVTGMMVLVIFVLLVKKASMLDKV